MANTGTRNITWDDHDGPDHEDGGTGMGATPQFWEIPGTDYVGFVGPNGSVQAVRKSQLPSAGSAPRQGDPDLASNQALERESLGRQLAQKQAELAEQQRQFNEKFGMEKSMFNQRQAVDEGGLTGYFRGAPTLDRDKLGENSYQFSATQAFDYYRRLQDLASNPRNFVANFFQNRGQAVPPGAQAYGNTSQKLSAMKPFEQFLPEFLGSQGRGYGRGASVGSPVGAQAAYSPVEPPLPPPLPPPPPPQAPSDVQRAPVVFTPNGVTPGASVNYTTTNGITSPTGTLAATGVPGSQNGVTIPLGQFGGQEPAWLRAALSDVGKSTASYPNSYEDGGTIGYDPGNASGARHEDSRASRRTARRQRRDDDGVIPEPVIGRGVISGQTYTFGERGPEGVVPAHMLPDFLKRRGGEDGLFRERPRNDEDEDTIWNRWEQARISSDYMTENRPDVYGGEVYRSPFGSWQYPQMGGMGPDGSMFSFSTSGQGGVPARMADLEDRHRGAMRAMGRDVNSYALGGLIGYDEGDPYGVAPAPGGEPTYEPAPPTYPYMGPNDPTSTPAPLPTAEEQGFELRAGMPTPQAPIGGLPSTTTGPAGSTPTVIPPAQPFALTPEQQAEIQRQIAETAARNRQGPPTSGNSPFEVLPPQDRPNGILPPPIQQPVHVPQGPTTATPVAAAPAPNPFTGQLATNRDASAPGTFGRSIPGAGPAFLSGEDTGESTLQALLSSGMLPPFLSRLFGQRAGVQSVGTNQPQAFNISEEVPIVSELALSQMTPSEREAFLSFVSSYGVEPSDYLDYVRSLGPTGGAAQSPLFGANLRYNRQ